MKSNLCIHRQDHFCCALAAGAGRNDGQHVVLEEAGIGNIRKVISDLSLCPTA